MRRITFVKPAKPTETKSAADETKLAENNPLRRADDSKSSEQDSNVKGISRTSGLASESSQKQNSIHDPALLTMIERELKDETPEEQQILFNDWKGLDPALVRELIRLHRATRHITQTASLQQASPANRTQAVGFVNQPGMYQSGIPAMNTFPGAGHGADIRYFTQPSVLPASPSLAGLGANPWNTRYQTAAALPSYQAFPTTMSSGYQNPPPYYTPNNTSYFPGSQIPGNQPATGFQPQPTGQLFASPSGVPAGNGYGVPRGNLQIPGIHPRTAPVQQQVPSIQPTGTQQPSRYATFGDPAMGMTSHSIGFLNSGSPADRMGNASQSFTNQQTIPTLPTTRLSSPKSGPIPTGIAGSVDPFRTISSKPSQSIPPPDYRTSSYATALNQNLTDAGDGWNGDLQKLISSVQDSLSKLQLGTTEEDKKLYVERHVFLRMLYLMSGQQERALQPIPGLNSADQEFWQQVFWGIANYFSYEAMPDASDRATQTIAQLRLAIQKLQEEARLELRNVVFARNIASFGNYTSFERDDFSPGQPVLVYAEVSNFKSESTADGQYRTILRSTIEIMTPDGRVVERMVFPATEDLCRNYRGDYFHSYEFSIPQRASLGPHVLKLTVVDQLKKKVATYSRNFTVR
ncbi:MAG: hypothetical protein IH899_17645 [Planctomycetes bacterium]|nr:hypothetical protein [Planctomycetota bacterium]